MTAQNQLLSWDRTLSHTLSSKKVLCWWKQCPRGFHRSSAHRHIGTEVIFCEKGNGAMRIGGRNYKVTAQTVLVFPAPVPHGPLMNRDYERWNLSFVPNYGSGDPLFTNTIFHHRIDDNTDRRIREVFKEIKSEIAEHDSDTERYVRLLIEQLFLLMRRSHIKYPASITPVSRSNIEAGPAAELIDYIETHFQYKLSVQHLAEAFNYSEGHIWRLIRSFTGQSPIDYINERRLNEASKLLLHTDQPIASISDQVGFGNPAYFTRLFKRKQAMTPNEYRARHREDVV